MQRRPLVIAHRGWSGRHPEQTRAAYEAAIELAARTGAALGLECDVHPSADGELVCLHDLDLARTGAEVVAAIDLTVAELKSRDVGSWFAGVGATAAERELVTLDELFDMVARARARQVDVYAVVETKHPNPRGLRVEQRLVEMLRARGWTDAMAPVRMISFLPEAVSYVAERLPDLARSQLLARPPQLAPEEADAPAVSPWLGTLKRDPGLVGRAHRAGREVHVWTVNEPADIAWCLDLGVDAITSDHPDRVLRALGTPAGAGSPRGARRRDG